MLSTRSVSKMRHTSATTWEVEGYVLNRQTLGLHTINELLVSKKLEFVRDCLTALQAADSGFTCDADLHDASQEQLVFSKRNTSSMYTHFQTVRKTLPHLLDSVVCICM